MNQHTNPPADNVKPQRPFKKLHCDWRTRLFSELKGARLAVWLYHYMRSDRDDNSRPSLSLIAKDTGYDRDTVKIARKWLVNSGWLVKTDSTKANVAIMKAVFPGDDWAENPPSSNALIVQPGGKSAQAQATVGGKHPLGRAENPPSLGGKSPRGVGGKPRQEVDSSEEDSRVDKREVEKVRADAPPASLSSAHLAASAADRQGSVTDRRSVCSEYFVWLNQTWLDLSLSKSQKRQVRQFILGSSVDLRLISLASERILDPLDVKNSYDRAGERLAENLPEKCSAIQAELDRQRDELERMARQQAEIARQVEIQVAPAEEEFDESLFEPELPQEDIEPAAVAEVSQ